MRNMCVSYKKQELLTLRDHLSSSMIFLNYGVHVDHLFNFLSWVFCFICLHSVFLVQCYLRFCVVHYWLIVVVVAMVWYKLKTICWKNQCLSPLKLWVQAPFMARCTRYNIMRYRLSVNCDRLLVFSGYSGLLHQKDWPPWNSWNIVESDAKHHKPNHTVLDKKNCYTLTIVFIIDCMKFVLILFLAPVVLRWVGDSCVFYTYIGGMVDTHCLILSFHNLSMGTNGDNSSSSQSSIIYIHCLSQHFIQTI